ncbi:hypothetical protein [Phyllobacterium sp. K27]
MSDSSTTTIRAIFETRDAAEMAVEHLVQQHGVERPNVFIQSATSDNTAGTAPSAQDNEAKLGGEIEISVEIAANQVSVVQHSLGDAGAIRVSGK